jgi:hypothetical protein
MQQALTLETIGDLDSGAARVAINRTIARAIADIDDRGDDGKVRTVTIKLELKRMNNGLIESNIVAGASVPAYRTNSTIAEPKRKGDETQLLFQSLAPDDPHQRTLDELTDEEREAKRKK